MSLIIYRLSEKRNWLEIKRFRNGDFHTWLKWKLFDGVNGWKLSHMHSDIHVSQMLCRTVTVQINLHQSINQSAGVSTTIFCVFMITWKRDSIEKNESSSSLVSFYLSRLLFFFEFIFFFWHKDDIMTITLFWITTVIYIWRFVPLPVTWVSVVVNILYFQYAANQ